MKVWIVPRLQVLLGIAALMLTLQVINSLSGNALNVWGVLPRYPASLPGILAAPWLHAGWWFGLLPSQGVSFEYHLFGALCGVLYAALTRRSLATGRGLVG